MVEFDLLFGLGERRQSFQWVVNALRYEYGPNLKKSIDIHVVVYREEWQIIDPHTLGSVTKDGRQFRLGVNARLVISGLSPG